MRFRVLGLGLARKLRGSPRDSLGMILNRRLKGVSPLKTPPRVSPEKAIANNPPVCLVLCWDWGILLVEQSHETLNPQHPSPFGNMPRQHGLFHR